MTILESATLGNTKGITSNGVTEFLGIKYATLKNRFAEAEITQHSSTETLDATKLGNASLQVPFALSIEFEHAQHSLQSHRIDTSSVDCLNLNITLPEGCSAASKLPVLVYIHGGAFFVGCNSWPQYQMRRFVKLSVEKGVPTIVVTINYRLGPPGFMSSAELRGAGYKPNNGIRDQRVAFTWIHKYIQEFGGDPENITAAGQSAGGASVVYNLHSHEPLFRRAVSISGTSPLMKGFPYEFHEEMYKKAVEALGLRDADPEDRINALLTMPDDELVRKIPVTIQTAPAIDNEVIHPGVSHSVLENLDSKPLPGMEWCQELLIGENEADSSILGWVPPHIRINPAARFTDAVNKILSSQPAVAHEILKAYNITPDTPDETAVESVFKFLGDIKFHAPALNFVHGWKGKGYVYYFNEGNPWEGPWKGRANHILEVFYLFQNFNEFLTAEQKQVATAFAHDVLKFCHGISPWPAITPGQIQTVFSARVYGPSQEGHVSRIAGRAFGGESMQRGILFDSAAKTSWSLILQIHEELTSA
ncbi:hypothetical protein N7468_003695 [Penicillium chermesinum]|uniref:Carboxylesterase type B domain-containing protein n=1 Tax=Penicillium chermesinum TaxID=63820 RepID=A0A9W9TRU7_9EURO|nr:uncharacterized protein N7468_003695 [Penicillium chermesinum]KAJ5239076.1 hypothetical protein N7468_003695 [Penicillium chermesinum]KAJ6164715.1 hypothetical protein N7470_003387 [Penicillium chermesinum]